MTPTNLVVLAQALPEAWRSTVVAGIGDASLKILRMDQAAHEEEMHAHDEAFVVLEGELQLTIAGKPSVLRRHELCVIPAGVLHGVPAGSAGTLLIVDAHARQA